MSTIGRGQGIDLREEGVDDQNEEDKSIHDLAASILEVSHVPW